MEKAAGLAAENVALKATVDELNGQKLAADEKIRDLQAEVVQM